MHAITFILNLKWRGSVLKNPSTGFVYVRVKIQESFEANLKVQPVCTLEI